MRIVLFDAASKTRQIKLAHLNEGNEECGVSMVLFDSRKY